MGGEFVPAGHAHSCIPVSRNILIHIGQDTYEMTIEAMQHVLSGASAEDLYRRVPQTTLDRYTTATPSLEMWGTIGLSHTRRSVTVRPKDGRLYVINADALRDVVHKRIDRAAVSEVIYTSSLSKKATLA